jgi:hypothetical protein
MLLANVSPCIMRALSPCGSPFCAACPLCVRHHQLADYLPPTRCRCCIQSYFGSAPGGGAPSGSVAAAAPPGMWISQWRVGQRHRGPAAGHVFLIQGVLCDGTRLPPLGDSLLEDAADVATVEAAGGCFTTLHGR